ncbi:MAG TPA: pyroglutamyl-peptidase I [Candidatus Didemnitutus sp.]|nr:pyroglutamyl-peptidase I [Candidatus Didemnitutus sp.]
MKKILLTGFEPFGGDSLNPSEEVARQLNGANIARHEIAGALLPCVFGAALKELKHQVRLHEPALVLCLGQAGGRAEITPERIAINIEDARVPDNAGQQPVDKPVIKGGPAAYWSTLPIKAIVQALRKKDIPAAVSQTAGTFVCNHVFYGLMHELESWPDVRGGFMHLPYLPEQTATGPSLAFEQMTTGVRLALETAISYRRDVKTAGGRES